MKKLSGNILAFLALVLMLNSCSSLSDLKRMAMGESQAELEDEGGGRSPASSKKGSVVITNTEFDGNITSQPIGSDLGRNEFGVTSNYRNGKDPWYGTGPENEGSLWNPDSQDNFYFTVNTNFKVGDILYVTVERDVNDTLNAKIAALLGQNGKSVRKIAAEEAEKEVASAVGDKLGTAIGNKRVGEAIGRDLGQSVESAIDLKEEYVNLDKIPVRVVESLDQRIFKIAGDRRVFIRNAPYRIAMTGRIRHEDVSPDGQISSTLVLESKVELTK